MLERIDAHADSLNAFITVTADFRHANRLIGADEARGAGNAGALCGLPIVHKDLFCTKGVLTTCGSHILDNFVSPYDATVVERLAAAGAVMLGKTNMDEFAMGSSNETSYYGPVPNPWDTTTLSPGGSSGGSAAAVAARLVPAATGTDTGGSIRQPAALTGTTGIKADLRPRVSRYGMMAFASSLDQAGVITRSAEDAAMLLGVMAGLDPRDSTSSIIPCPTMSPDSDSSLEGLKIGIVRQHFDEGLDSRACGDCRSREALKALEDAGASLVEVDLPNIGSVGADLLRRRTGGMLPRTCRDFDGVRFGHRTDDPETCSICTAARAARDSALRSNGA